MSTPVSKQSHIILPLRRCLLLLLCASSLTLGRCNDGTNRPENWARQMTLEGVPNLHMVSDTLYRSAQPSAEGVEALQKMGIKTVINLRSFHTDIDALRGTQLACEAIPMKAWHPDFDDAARFIKIATDPTRQPVLVHCQSLFNFFLT